MSSENSSYVDIENKRRATLYKHALGVPMKQKKFCFYFEFF